MKRTTLRESVRGALRDALRRDPRVLLLGEDAGRYGGANACSSGLLEEFGGERVRDTPCGDSAFVGAAIGAAIGGLRPIVEVTDAGAGALEQLVDNAAALRHTSGGQLSVPLVVRMAMGARRGRATHHAHGIESWYARVPGLKVLTPGTVQDARDMLLAALEDPDPVVVFEHEALYEMEGPLDDAKEAPEPWRAAVRRPGRDVSIFAWGGTLPLAMSAADLLCAEGIDAEVVDVRSLRPLDGPAIRASVGRTHRAVVVDEGWRTGSLAAEILARIAEESLGDLTAAPRRVCAADVPIPYARHLEEAVLPSALRIADAVRETMSSGV